MNKPISTKKTEEITTTSDLEFINGKYLAKRLLRTWKEDFIDSYIGETIEIERNEILFLKVTKIYEKILSEINFFLQSWDIKEVSVSNQERCGTLVNSMTSVYQITALYSNKKQNFYLYSNSAKLAFEIATDFLEQKLDGNFSIVAVKEIGFSILLPDEEDVEKEHYKVEVSVTKEDNDSYNQIYILKANDAEEAKEQIILFITAKQSEVDKKESFEVKIISAKTIPCNSVIGFEFSKVYLEE